MTHEIVADLANLIKIDHVYNKTCIVFDADYFSKLVAQSDATNTSAQVVVSVFRAGGGLETASFIQQKLSDWLSNDTTLSDQLADLNAFADNSIEYELRDQLSPTRLRVTQINPGNFETSLRFPRIKKVRTHSEFKRDFVLTTSKTFVTTLSAKTNPRTISMIASNDSLRYFDATGRGFGDFVGWYLCNGLNGTPDLRGRFLVGLDPADPDYNQTGLNGGIARLNQIHNVTRQEKIMCSKTIASKKGSNDEDNDDDTLVHNKKVVQSQHSDRKNGPCVSNSSTISWIGDKNVKTQENRPPYFVVQYIIYMK